MMMREDSDEMETVPISVPPQPRAVKAKEIASPAEVIPLLVDKMPTVDSA
jgi:hypothetical protein